MRPSFRAWLGRPATKQMLFAVTVIVVATVAVQLYVRNQNYYPVVRISSPDGLVFTAVQDPMRARDACSAANNRFLGPIKKQCGECKVVRARCERELEPFELALYEGRALEQHQVLTSGLRLGIAGPPNLAKASCELMAGELTKVHPATCVYPKSGK